MKLFGKGIVNHWKSLGTFTKTLIYYPNNTPKAMTTTLQDHLETFRTSYPVTKCLVDHDRITYVFKTFYNAYRSSNDANMLIQRLKLPLVAIHYGNNGFFTVQSNETEA